MTVNKSIEDQARHLAEYNREADPAITKVLWFPHDAEVRMVFLSEDVTRTPDDLDLHPFYFRPSPADGLTFPSVMAVIAPEEYKSLRLPADWGTWDDAQELLAPVCECRSWVACSARSQR